MPETIKFWNIADDMLLFKQSLDKCLRIVTDKSQISECRAMRRAETSSRLLGPQFPAAGRAIL